AVVVEAVAADLDAAVRRLALVLAPGRVAAVEVVPAVALRVGALAGGDGALRVLQRAGHGARVHALRRAVQDHAVVAARAAVRDAVAGVDVLVLEAVAVVVEVVAERLGAVRVRGAVVLAGPVPIEIVELVGAGARAGPGGDPRVRARIARQVLVVQ